MRRYTPSRSSSSRFGSGFGIGRSSRGNSHHSSNNNAASAANHVHPRSEDYDDYSGWVGPTREEEEEARMYRIMSKRVERRLRAVQDLAGETFVSTFRNKPLYLVALCFDMTIEKKIEFVLCRNRRRGKEIERGS